MKYLCFYDSETGRRKIKMASVNKINYICSALNRVGIDVEIVSCSMTAPQKMRTTAEKLNSHTSVRYFRTSKEAKSMPGKVLQLIRRNLTIFWYLLFHTKKGERVIAYHSLINMRSVLLAKKIKRFRLILEAEEIYNDVFQRSAASRKTEMRYLQSAEQYLFPTELLAEKINPEHKPQALVYGAYQAERGKTTQKRPVNGKIRVAYTGSFDPNKGGLKGALEAARFLDERYQLCILGTDTPERVKALKEHIALHSGKDSCEICYDGIKKGKAYTDYLKTCQIGLSTQNPDAGFNNTSFPSKVISYLSCNLRVVSYPIEVLTSSALNDVLYYYTQNTPQAVANAIMGVDVNADYDGQSVISALDSAFLEQLRQMDLKGEVE